MRAPWFWQRDGRIARLLDPLGRLYGAATARRVARPGWGAPVPVICIGNATAGGTGKTTVALDIAARLKERGVRVAFLTRGYGGSASGRVDPARHRASVAGDEALLLAACAPTFVGADRAEAARMALEAGAQCLVMDDGLQNPTLRKQSLLVIDGAAGVGNGRLIPAGPLREPLLVAAARCRAAIIIGPDTHDIARRLAIPVLRARIESPEEVRDMRLFAFAGIGRPEKFFATLRAAGADVVGTRGFADHHRYSSGEIASVLKAAWKLGAEAVTTPKDAVRLTADQRARVRVAEVRLIWEEPALLERLLTSMLRVW